MPQPPCLALLLKLWHTDLVSAGQLSIYCLVSPAWSGGWSSLIIVDIQALNQYGSLVCP